MTEKYHHWYSRNLGLDVEMLVFGDRGYPVILFPTSQGKFHQNKDEELVESVRWFVEEGFVKIYCPESFDWLTWYNKGVDPAGRAHRYAWYDKMLNDELAPWAMHETGVSKVATAGCSFGGYHAVNFGLKHPDKVGHIFSMSGAFDITQFTDGFYNDDIFYNNPVDFLPGSNQPELWQINIILGIAEHDICRPDNERLANIMTQKNINHWLDIRGIGSHDWPMWKAMFPHYLSTIK